ncbi:MAG: sigma-70 family RNA polymerase sigma factor [Gammaproteobacteria bacterium]|nr:sigma-70 family RNA polymerase sigma factor [Gammaproteobacteria bacterium]
MSEDLKPWFSQQIESNMDSLYFLALRLTGCKTRAEDLVAETVGKAWSNINKLQDHSRFRPWIFRILNNYFISDYRKQSIRPPETSYDEISTDNTNQDEISCLLIQQSNEFLHWWANPEKEFGNQILAEDIMTAIESLPEVFRITVLLVNVEGFSYDEAALILDVPPGTIRSRMKRGRTLLQKSLWQHAKDAGIINSEETGVIS